MRTWPFDLIPKPRKKSHIRDSLILAGTEGAFSNTSTPDFEVTNTLIQSLIDLARKLQKLGVRDVGGVLTYEEENL